jgi:hypothetical protein
MLLRQPHRRGPPHRLPKTLGGHVAVPQAPRANTSGGRITGKIVARNPMATDHPQRGCQCDIHRKERQRGRRRSRSLSGAQRMKKRAAGRTFYRRHRKKLLEAASRYYWKHRDDPHAPANRWRRAHAPRVREYSRRYNREKRSQK